MKTITICSSAHFYKEVVDLKKQLQAMGYAVIIPHNAETMERTNDYDVSHYKTWFNNEDDYDKKAALMHGHFDEVAKADVVLVVNNKKHGIDNYIGGNVLMEMAVAFHLQKPIVLLNDFPKESAFYEEIRGSSNQTLQGNLATLAKLYPA